MGKIDKLPIRGAYKIDIYDRYVTSCIRFDLQVCDVARSNLEELDSKVRTYLRKWCRMPPSTHIGHTFHSMGLDICLPSQLYIVGHASTLLSPTPNDQALREAVQTVLDDCQDSTQTPDDPHRMIIELAQACDNNKELKRQARSSRNSQVESHASSCVKQGNWLEVLAHMDSDMSWKSMLCGHSESS